MNWIKRQKIAEYCGWTHVKPSGRLDGQLMGYPPKTPQVWKYEEIPDYFNDLNAMQQPWDCLGWEEKNECIEILKEIVKDAYCEVYFATAAQRAEAFLKTLKLWTTTPESVELKERE